MGRRVSQGFFVLGTAGTLAGVGIILALQQPRSLLELRAVFCLQNLWSKTALRWFCLGIAVGLLVQFAPVTWFGRNTTQQIVIRRAAGEGGLAWYVVGLLLMPIPEEMIMRSYLYNGFRNQMGRPLALALMAIAGAVFHLGNIGGSSFAAYLYAGQAILFCLIFDSRRNLVDSIACHMAYNSVIAIFVIRWVMQTGH
jgi:membrane protease YdiL (CAAX protease family)